MKKFLSLLTICVIFGILGCSAYFNIMYNANKLFAQAEARELDTNGRVSRKARKEYNDVIKKCALVLEFYENSEWTDDAILLMAKSFYRKGGNKSKAIEQCDKLINFFSDSPVYSEAVILKSQILRDLRKEDESFSLLEINLLSSQNKDDQAKILLQLSKYYTADEEYDKARYYLNKIINEHAKSDEAEKANFYIGESFYSEANYISAKESYEKYLKQSITRDEEFLTKYKIAKCQYNLKNYQKAYKIIRKIYKKEYRKKEKGQYQAFLGQILIALNRDEEAIDLLDSLIKGKQRGSSAAEAHYILGDYYLTETDSLHLAIKHFNEVKKADSKSDYIEESVAKSAVASQIKLFKGDEDESLEPQQLVNEQFKLADYYLDIMELPDSALVVYDKIINTKSLLRALADTLVITVDSLQTKVDSLDLVKVQWQNEVDSLRIIVNNTDLSSINDSLNVVKIDSLQNNSLAVVKGDTLNVTKVDSVSETVNDSLIYDPNGKRMLLIEANIDTLNTIIDSTNTLIDNKQTRITKIDEIMDDFDDEFIPFSNFIKVYIYVDIKKDTLNAKIVQEEMNKLFPNSKYTYGINHYLDKGELILTTEKSQRSKLLYSRATEMLDNPAYTDSTITNLESVMDSLETKELIKANMTLGYLYFIVKKDTLNARSYFDNLTLKFELTDEQHEWLEKYFPLGNFIKVDDLPGFHFEEVVTDTLVNVESDSLSIADNPEDDNSSQSLDNTIIPETESKVDSLIQEPLPTSSEKIIVPQKAEPEISVDLPKER